MTTHSPDHLPAHLPIHLLIKQFTFTTELHNSHFFEIVAIKTESADVENDHKFERIEDCPIVI